MPLVTLQNVVCPFVFYMSQPELFYFYDREYPELADCVQCHGEPVLSYETSLLSRRCWVHVSCKKCNHSMTVSGIGVGDELLYVLAEEVISRWNKKPFKFKLIDYRNK